MHQPSRSCQHVRDLTEPPPVTGNVHGVYAPGNVELQPEILHNTQKYLKEQLSTEDDKPAYFVFHGGSGSSVDDIRYAIKARYALSAPPLAPDRPWRIIPSHTSPSIITSHQQPSHQGRRFSQMLECSFFEISAVCVQAGTIKMNIDTDTQWAFWDGIRQYEAKYHDYLQGQIGNPESETKPNKKYYDPRMALRSGEEAMAARLIQAAEDLNCVNVL